MWAVTSGTVSRIAQLFNAQERKKLHGIVGSYELTQQAFGFGARDALTLIAIISLSLAVVNLFPFLPLDGGHIFWSVVEKLRGRPVSFRVIEGASVVGFVLVLMLFAVGLSNDLSRGCWPGLASTCASVLGGVGGGGPMELTTAERSTETPVALDAKTACEAFQATARRTPTARRSAPRATSSPARGASTPSA